MSWMRLLKASPTFTGMAPLKQRYRMKQSSLIPSFGSARRMAGKGESRTVAAPAQTASTPVVATAKAAPVNVFSAPMEQGGAQRQGATTSRATPSAARASGVAWLGWTFSRVVSWFSLRTEPRGVRVVPMPGRKLVQPELRLDAVKPLRNDLSDCDFEVCETRPAAKATVARESGPFTRVDGTADRAKALTR